MADPSLAAAYATLGLQPGASLEEVKRAWRKAARASHPDLHPDDPDAERRFLAAEAAHALLSDPVRVAGAAHAPARTGPDDDWIDTCAWIAEAHLLHLRREVLPAYTTAYRAGPSLVAALNEHAATGLGAGAPPVTPTRWGRLWSRRRWRRLGLVVEDGHPYGGGPVALVQTREGPRVVLWPRALWAAGLRDEDTLREFVPRAVDVGVAAAAPRLFEARPDPSPDADRRWWVGQLFWPTVWGLALLLSVFLLVSGWNAR